MSQKIPNSVIGAAASVIANHYHSHSRLNTLFMESGAPGDAPEGNCEKKCSTWLKRCNDDPGIDALEVLGAVIQEYMDQQPPSSPFGGSLSTKVSKGQKRIRFALEKDQLAYRINGYVTKAGSALTTKTLEDFLRSGDFSSIEKEFERTIEHIRSDPYASITASCSIIEATLKFYIESFEDLATPNKLNVMPLWDTVRPHLPLNADPILAADQNKVFKGISSVIDGIGSFRSHIGSAHGRGSNPPTVTIAEAHLAVNAAHTIVIFIMELLHARA